MRFDLIGYLNQIGLVSVCAKFQLPRLSSSGLKLVGSGRFQMNTVSNLNPRVRVV